MNDVDPLASPVFDGGRYKPFGKFTLADVKTRATELRAVTGIGAAARLSSVARAWAELAHAMATLGADTVADLPKEAAREFARRTWAQPPSLL